MPTVSESTDPELRAGKASSVLDYWCQGMLGDATLVASLRILKYEPEEIRHMMEQRYTNGTKRRVSR